MLSIDATPRIEATMDLRKVPLIKGTDKRVCVDDNLALEKEDQLLAFLRKWSRRFTWDVED